MVFDRITLTRAYSALELVQESEGYVRNILFNKSSGLGTKTVPRFKDLTSLKSFINEQYPYTNFEYKCATGEEGLWTLLAFEIYSRQDKIKADIVAENNRRSNINIQPLSRHAIFVNNIRGQFQSQKKEFQNKLNIKKIDRILKIDRELERLFNQYQCKPYIEDQSNYIEEPAAYIESLKNKAYNTVIDKYYKPTRLLFS